MNLREELMIEINKDGMISLSRLERRFPSVNTRNILNSIKSLEKEKKIEVVADTVGRTIVIKID